MKSMKSIRKRMARSAAPRRSTVVGVYYCSLALFLSSHTNTTGSTCSDGNFRATRSYSAVLPVASAVAVGVYYCSLTLALFLSASHTGIKCSDSNFRFTCSYSAVLPAVSAFVPSSTSSPYSSRYRGYSRCSSGGGARGPSSPGTASAASGARIRERRSRAGIGGTLRLSLTYDDDDDDDDEDAEGNRDDDPDEDEDDEDELEDLLPVPDTHNDGSLDDLIDSISWLPSVSSRNENHSTHHDDHNEKITRIRRDARLLPLFPLGPSDMMYTPHSDPTLSISEPRYIEMYDYLLSHSDGLGEGGKPEFVVTMSHPSEGLGEPGVFAQTGVLFRIVDFVEMTEGEARDVYYDDGDNNSEEELGGLFGGRSDSNGDERGVRYVASHEVAGIVKIDRVLNPADWEGGETYLRVEATVVDDLKEEEEEGTTFVPRQVWGGTGTEIPRKKGSAAPRRKWKSDDDDDKTAVPTSGSQRRQQTLYEDILDLRDLFSQLVDVQHSLNEDVRFARQSVSTFSRGVAEGPRGFWLTVLSWQQYADQRMLSRHVELQAKFQEGLMDLIGPDREAPEIIDVQDLPPSLRDEAAEVERRVKMELGPLRLELSLDMQRLLQATDRGDRVRILGGIVGRELQRLRTKKAVSAIFQDNEKEDASVHALDRSMSTSEERENEEAARVEEARLRLERAFGRGAAGSDDRPDASASNNGSSSSRGTTKAQPLSFDDMDAFQ